MFDNQGFHWRNNIYWKRLDDGSVRIAFFGTRASGEVLDGDDDEPVRELIIPPNEWASIVAAVSQQGGASEGIREAHDAILVLCGRHGLATGHGDTVADMIREADAQLVVLLGARPTTAEARGVNPTSALGRSNQRCNELYWMIKFLREREGECLGDHPKWLAGMDKLLDGHSFDALTELK